MKPWDWDHYAEQVRKAQYDLDESQLKPYFELDNVLKNGVFYAANKLYGLTFKERKDIPVWQPDVRVFEVTDFNGKTLGLIYFDYFKRDNKAGGAWMSNLVEQSHLLGNKPVIYNVAQFHQARARPARAASASTTSPPCSTNSAMRCTASSPIRNIPLCPARRWRATLSNSLPSSTSTGRSIPRCWRITPSITSTHQPMPKALADKIRKSQTFNQGYALGELLAAAELDMRWHELAATAPRQKT